MPKRSKSQRLLEESDADYVQDTDEASDIEDFVPAFAGKTRPGVVSGTGRFRFSPDVMTCIFKHAIRHRYCASYPPPIPVFISLLNDLSIPLQGLRYSDACVRAIAEWIQNNLCVTRLGGLFVQETTGRLGSSFTYKISISPTLVAAVESPDFSFDWILALQNPSNDISKRHAACGYQFVSFAASLEVLPEQSWRALIDQVLGELIHSGRVSRPTNASSLAPHLGPFMHHHPHLLHQPPPAPPLPSQQVARTSSYSPVAEPLYATDKERAADNEQCWRFWSTWFEQTLRASAERVGRAELNQTLPQVLLDQRNWNGGHTEFDPSKNYVRWYINHQSQKSEGGGSP